MYDLADTVPNADVDPGTNLLIVGAPMTGKRRLGMRILASGSNEGEGAIMVTTKDGASRLIDEYARLVRDIDSVPLGVIDCVTKQQGMTDLERDDRIRYTTSPVDMTGIGINLSEYLEEFYTVRGLRRNRVMLHSLSTLLMYANLQTVFRFLHVFTGRIQSANALGVYVIDADTHDQQTMNTLKQLFDGMLSVSDDGDVDLHMAR